MIAREHVGYGWGDPLDATQPEVWLHNGYVCVYDPGCPGRVELWTQFGIADSRFANTNTHQAKEADSINKARGSGQWLREWLHCTEIGSRFD